MIRINLLTVERKAGPPSFSTGGVSQKITIVCSALLTLTALSIGWRYWTVRQESARLDQDLIGAREETVRLRAITVQVQQFEQQKTTLQQRVGLIEQLRKNQAGPVRLLDYVSRALPPALWLSSLKQTGDSVVIDGMCTGLTSLSDFMSNLEASGYFKKSIEIVSSRTESTSAPQGELVKFSIKAVFQPAEGARTQ
jgi:Tfp pilus assembly protein PilN